MGLCSVPTTHAHQLHLACHLQGAQLLLLHGGGQQLLRMDSLPEQKGDMGLVVVSEVPALLLRSVLQVLLQANLHNVNDCTRSDAPEPSLDLDRQGIRSVSFPSFLQDCSPHDCSSPLYSCARTRPAPCHSDALQICSSPLHYGQCQCPGCICKISSVAGSLHSQVSIRAKSKPLHSL